VKQSGVISPILFCINIDDLQVSLSQLGVGCYIPGNFVGAIDYADDIVLISPTPLGMRKLLFSCDSYANEFDIIFNASKSKFLVCIPRKFRWMFNNLNVDACLFYIGGRRIENITSYSHLGHIINCHGDDKDDVLQRRCNFSVQVNNVFCFFQDTGYAYKNKLLKSYCSGIYESELWSFRRWCSSRLSWRTALRRLLNLPFNAHCFLLPILMGALSVFCEICKRSSRFINSCLYSRNNLVRSIALHSIVHGKYYSPLGRNRRFCCRRFSWQLEDFSLGYVSLNDDCFHNFCMNNIPVAQLQIASLVEELLSLREGFVTFDCGNFLSKLFCFVECRLYGVMETSHCHWTILILLLLFTAL